MDNIIISLDDAKILDKLSNFGKGTTSVLWAKNASYYDDTTSIVAVPKEQSLKATTVVRVGGNYSPEELASIDLMLNIYTLLDSVGKSMGLQGSLQVEHVVIPAIDNRLEDLIAKFNSRGDLTSNGMAMTNRYIDIVSICMSQWYYHAGIRLDNIYHWFNAHQNTITLSLIFPEEVYSTEYASITYCTNLLRKFVISLAELYNITDAPGIDIEIYETGSDDFAAYLDEFTTSDDWGNLLNHIVGNVIDPMCTKYFLGTNYSLHSTGVMVELIDSDPTKRKLKITLGIHDNSDTGGFEGVVVDYLGSPEDQSVDLNISSYLFRAFRMEAESIIHQISNLVDVGVEFTCTTPGTIMADTGPETIAGMVKNWSDEVSTIKDDPDPPPFIVIDSIPNLDSPTTP